MKHRFELNYRVKIRVNEDEANKETKDNSLSQKLNASSLLNTHDNYVDTKKNTLSNKNTNYVDGKKVKNNNKGNKILKKKGDYHEL